MKALSQFTSKLWRPRFHLHKHKSEDGSEGEHEKNEEPFLILAEPTPTARKKRWSQAYVPPLNTSPRQLRVEERGKVEARRRRATLKSNRTCTPLPKKPADEYLAPVTWCVGYTYIYAWSSLPALMCLHLAFVAVANVSYTKSHIQNLIQHALVFLKQACHFNRRAFTALPAHPPSCNGQVRGYCLRIHQRKTT